jgi:CheY-like chemotaxis protein
MANDRILMATSDDLHTEMKTLISELEGSPKLVGVGDGARLVNALTRLLLARQAPELIVLDLALPRISGRAAARMIRALERATDTKKTPILLFSDEEESDGLKSFCKEVKSAVHLRRRMDKSSDEQIKRLVKAVDRILKKKRGTR